MYKKILIPTDGSAFSTESAQAGAAFAKQIGAEVIGIFVAPEYQYQIYVDFVPPSFTGDEDYKASIQKAGDAYLEKIRSNSNDLPLAFSKMIVFSDTPAQEIVKAGEQNQCDLIFMGSHGRSGWGQILLGSVTTKVLSSCQIPVLVYRAKKNNAVK